MLQISSREHSIVKHLVKLQKSAQLRQQSDTTILDGIHLIQSYLSVHSAPVVPSSLIVSESGLQNDEIVSLVKRCERFSEMQIIQVTDAVFKKISAVKTPTGILAQITIPNPHDQSQASSYKSTSCILIESIQDPGNLGTMIRTAAAANISDIYLSADCTDAWSPKTLRAAMGAHFFLNIHSNCDLTKIADNFQGQVLATSPHTQYTLYQSDLTGPIAFIFGNEGAGLSHEALQTADKIIAIPIPGNTESLNAAAALAICLFEKIRQEQHADNCISRGSKAQ